MLPPILNLPPQKARKATVTLPGSKSISNRALLLAALASHRCRLERLLDADDTRYMREALEALGVKITPLGDDCYEITGVSGTFPVTSADLFLGNAGTAFRPLTAVLAFMPGNYRLDGVARMRERPIADLIDALRALGAEITYAENTGYPPLVIAPFHDSMVSQVAIKGSISSQFLSALLMALPLLNRDIAVVVSGELISRPYVAMTLKLMARFGVQVNNSDFKKFSLRGGQTYIAPKAYTIESDASSASYFLAAAFLSHTAITLTGIGADSIQGDIEFARELAKLGATLTLTPTSLTLSRNADSPLAAFHIDALNIPDAAMTFAIIALTAGGTSVIHNIASWRVKETDRILAMQNELTKLGAKVVTTPDSIAITPPAKLTENVLINTYDDHRMAMCFALVSLLGVSVRIDHPACVAKTFPDFFTELAKICTPGHTAR